MANHPPPHLPHLQERHRPLARSQWRQLFLRLSVNFSARTTRDSRPVPRRGRGRRPRASRSPHKRRSKRSRSRHQQGHGSRGGPGEGEGSLIDRIGKDALSGSRHIGIFSVQMTMHSTALALSPFPFMFFILWCFLGLGLWELGTGR